MQKSYFFIILSGIIVFVELFSKFMQRMIVEAV